MKKRRVKIVLTKDGKKVAACAAAVVVLLALLLFFALFKVDSVSVVGSTRYSDEEIRQMAMGSPLDSNTLLAVWLHRHQEAEDIPFVESFDLEMLDSHSIRIHVNEKEIVGYVARDGQKMYFDKDGNVVESEQYLNYTLNKAVSRLHRKPEKLWFIIQNNHSDMICTK